MELNQEWLDENLGDTPRIRLRINLPLIDVIARTPAH